MGLSDENLRGRTVIVADGQAIGEIAALFTDSDAWRVESLQLTLRNEVADQLGATRGMFHSLHLFITAASLTQLRVRLGCASPTLRNPLPPLAHWGRGKGEEDFGYTPL